MLIIPIEHKPNWNHPPIATIAIIAINLLIFVFYQSGDTEVAENAVDYYLNSSLISNEQKLIETELHNDRSEQASAILQHKSQPHYKEALAYYAFYHIELDERIRHEWSREIHPDAIWAEQREKFETLRQDYSSFAFGLIPASASPLKYITCTFLHGSWGHIVGNMVFLFLFGFLLELVLGAWVYLGIYLLTGMLASFFFVLFNSGSQVPLVGASGAVSGLMGAYIAMYGVRKLKFFYTIGFYFGEFKAPALAILPLWLAKEIYGHLKLDDQVAYIAHFGGLISGAVVMFAYNRLKPQKTEQRIQTLTPKENIENERARKVLAEISAMSEKLDFDNAKNRCKSYLTVNPNDIQVWQAYFNLEKLHADHKPFHQMTFEFIKQVVTSPEAFCNESTTVGNIVMEYCALAKKPLVFNNDAITIRLINFLFTQQEHQTALSLLELKLPQLQQNKHAKNIFVQAKKYAVKKNDSGKIQAYDEILSQFANN